jgi:hypothetical protein
MGKPYIRDMRVYRFKSTGMPGTWGFTVNRDGAKLPIEFGPWEREQTIRSTKTLKPEIVAELERQRYCVFQGDVTGTRFTLPRKP